MLLAIARQLLEWDAVDHDYVRKWVNWEDSLAARAPDLPRTYESFVEAVAAGRTVAVEESDNFIHFKVNGVEVGEQLDAQDGEMLTLEARVIFPDGAPRRFARLRFPYMPRFLGAEQ